MKTVELEVQGMTCGSCVKHVTKALQAVPGVAHVEVNLASGRARVEGEFQAGGMPLIAALAVADYPASIVEGVATTQHTQTTGCQSGQGSKGGCCCG